MTRRRLAALPCAAIALLIAVPAEARLPVAATPGVVAPAARATASPPTATLLPIATPLPSEAPAATPAAAPAASAKPSPAAKEAAAPVIVRIGTMAVMTIREPMGSSSVAERAAVVQSRINQVLLHHPYLTWMDVKLLRDGGLPTVYWGPFSIIQVDAAHARLNNYSSADLLAHAWANSMRTGIKAFFAAKKMPERALWATPSGNAYTYRRSDRTMNKPTELMNTRYLFSPRDFDFGPGSASDDDQNAFVIFIRKDASHPPAEVYLGNGQGTFTAYDWIRPEDTP